MPLPDALFRPRLFSKYGEELQYPRHAVTQDNSDNNQSWQPNSLQRLLVP